MKNITHFIIVLFFCSFSYGQVQLRSLVDSSPVNKVYASQSVYLQAPCSVGTPSNNHETAIGSAEWPYIFANDFLVNASEVFTPDKLIFNLFIASGKLIDGVDLFFYANNYDRPGVELGSELAIVPSSQVVIATVGSRDVLEVVADLTNPVELEGGSTGSLYWVGIRFFIANSPYGDNPYIEVTTILNTPNEIYVSDDGRGWGAVSTSGLPEFDGVISLSGDCSTLWVQDNIKDFVSVYPIPTSDILNIKIPTSVQVKNVIMFDIFGKNVDVLYNNGVVDTSNLCQGVYLLKVETTAGIVTKRIVKQ